MVILHGVHKRDRCEFSAAALAQGLHRRAMQEPATTEPFRGSEARISRWILLREISHIWLPMMCNNVLTLLNEFSNTLFLGHSGSDAELAAVGLGNMMQNCCAVTLGIGLTGALDTFVNQAYGAGQHALCAQYLQRSRIICFLLVVDQRLSRSNSSLQKAKE